MEEKKATLEKYYYIEIVNPAGLGSGFFCHIENVKGKRAFATIPAFCADVMTFPTYNAANAFALEHGFNKWPDVKYYIKDSFDLIKETKGKSRADKQDLYYIENQSGWKCFYSEIKCKYYFDNKAHGYCVWFDEKSAEEAKDKFQKRFPIMELKVVKLVN